MKEQEEQRLKVEKGLERQAVMLGVRLKYLPVLGILIVLSLFPLALSFSFNTAVLSIVLCGVSYMAAQYADEHNLLDQLYSEKLPKTLINDLYKKLNRESD